MRRGPSPLRPPMEQAVIPNPRLTLRNLLHTPLMVVVIHQNDEMCVRLYRWSWLRRTWRPVPAFNLVVSAISFSSHSDEGPKLSSL